MNRACNKAINIYLQSFVFDAIIGAFIKNISKLSSDKNINPIDDREGYKAKLSIIAYCIL